MPYDADQMLERITDLIAQDTSSFCTDSNEGTLRTATLSTSIEDFWYHNRDIGVTRISSIGEQDRLRSYVFNTVRPNAFPGNLTVSTGKGLTRQAALASALGETYERYWAEPPRHLSELEYLKRHPTISERMPRVSYAELLGYPSYAKHDSDAILIGAQSLTTGDMVLVPAAMFLTPFRSDTPDRASDGIASGNSISESIIHGILELVERDAVTFMHFSREFAIIDRSTAPEFAQAILRAASTQDVDSVILYRRGLLELPVFEVILVDHLIPDPMLICAGSGCHIHPELALSRALTEALQTRACVIAGLREDLGPDYKGLRASGFIKQYQSLQAWLDSSETIRFPEERLDLMRSTPAQLLRTLVDLLARSGHATYTKLLTPTHLEPYVTSTCVSGLETMSTKRRLAGRRLRAVLKSLR